MTERDARSHVGQLWTAASADDWLDWYPVVDADGTIVDVFEPEGTLAEATARGWVYDEQTDLYRVDVPLSDLVKELLRHDVGADPVWLAREWTAAGYDVTAVRQWLRVGICYPEYATALTAAGYAPADVEDEFGGRATKKQVWDLVDRAQRTEPETRDGEPS